MAAASARKPKAKRKTSRKTVTVTEDDFSDFHIDQLVDDLRRHAYPSPLRLGRRIVKTFSAYAQHLAVQQGFSDHYVSDLMKVRDQILAADPRQSIVVNVFRYIFPSVISKIADVHDVLGVIKERCDEAERHFAVSSQTITELGVKKIRHGATVFVYGYSPEVVEILREAHKKKRSFTVLVGACDPLHGGKKMCTELNKAHIKSTFIPDAMLRYAVKRSDVVLMGCDSVDHHLKAYAPMGAELVCELAEKHHTACYICMDSWQYDPTRTIADDQNEYIHPDTLWNEPPARVEVLNLAYERIHANLIRGFICDIGIYAPKDLVTGIRQSYPTLFTKYAE